MRADLGVKGRGAQYRPLRRVILVNEPERVFCDQAEVRGWPVVTKRGWPDFFCIASDGRPVAVEVKKFTRLGVPQLLRTEQALLPCQGRKLINRPKGASQW